MMSWVQSYPISCMLFLPLLGGALLAVLPLGNRLLRALAVLMGTLVFFINLDLYYRFNPAVADLQFVETYSWIKAFNIQYFVGIDGISLFLTLLTSFLTPLVLLWTPIKTKRYRAHIVLVLLLESAMLGTFAAADLFLFYVFWETVLIPMYFLIGIWGGRRRVYASVKLLIYTMAGSFIMLAAILILMYSFHRHSGYFSSAIPALYSLPLSDGLARCLFLGFSLAFLIKIPVVPLHTWLPDAHVEAPTGGSVILAGVLLKMGGYGLIRLAIPLFPEAARYFAPWMAALGLIGIVYGALLAWVQRDLKKLVAYSSVSHLGFVVLGIFSLSASGTNGAIFLMLSHGLSTGALFFLVGMLYQRLHTRNLGEMGGMATPMPVFASALFIVCMASAGLPGLSGFIGEFLVLLAAFGSNKAWAFTAGVGVILAAVYLLHAYERVALGPLSRVSGRKLNDLGIKEVCVLAALIIPLFILGMYPGVVFDSMKASVEKYVQHIHPKDQSVVLWNP